MISFSDFKDILVERQVFIFIVGYLISGEIRKLTASIIDNLIEPLFDMDINQDEKHHSFFKKEYRTKGMTFKFGSVLKSILNFIIVVFISMFIAHLFQKTVTKVSLNETN